ncbi:MAG: 2-C-methyl-D-erythritol 4-phosphate cytidylyltransferase [Thermoguttaceae bacterium]
MNDSQQNLSTEPIFSVIVAAAGRSVRFLNSLQSSSSPKSLKSDDPLKKPFVSICGKPIWLHSVEKFANRSDVKKVILVIAPDDMDWFCDLYSEKIDQYYLSVVAGGAERVDSVQNALNGVTSEYVAIHDAARPCVTTDEIDAVFLTAQKAGAAILASPIRGTIKRTKLNAKNKQNDEIASETNDDKITEERSIVETISRDNLWEAHTPQVFRRELLEKAYSQRKKLFVTGNAPTDDAEIVEKLGISVSIVLGTNSGLKITTKSDIRIAQMILSGADITSK